MILADTSVWVDHLRHGDARLTMSLDRSEILSHPFVIGELALASMRNRESILAALRDLPQAIVAAVDEILDLIEHRRLHSLGLGYVDVHLLAPVLLTPGAHLWTRDLRLADAAGRFRINFQE